MTDDIPLDITGHEDRADRDRRERTSDERAVRDEPRAGSEPPGEQSDRDLLTGDASVDDGAEVTPTPEAGSGDGPATDAGEDNAPDPHGNEDDDAPEPVEVLVQLADDGEIDPWDIDVVQVTDKFLDAIEGTDLRTSGRALFYASVLVRMKSDAMLGTDEPEETREPEVSDDAEPEAVPESITLVVNGEGYTFEDGETFGRRDDGWLQDLVEACGGSDEVSYVSSEHLEITIQDDGVYVADVSRNGTALNGSPLDGGEAKVEDGDTLTLAERAEIDVEL